jgi:hypothetical protein
VPTLAEAARLAQPNNHGTLRHVLDAIGILVSARAMASLACAGPRASVRARSYHASPGACQANVLCISLWMLSVNMLVTAAQLWTDAGCGKVDNRGDNALPGRGLSAVHRSASYPQASCAGCSFKPGERPRTLSKSVGPRSAQSMAVRDLRRLSRVVCAERYRT